MTKENRLLDADKLLRWLEIMAEGMERHKEEYSGGAARAYRISIEVIKLGVFDERT